MPRYTAWENATEGVGLGQSDIDGVVITLTGYGRHRDRMLQHRFDIVCRAGLCTVLDRGYLSLGLIGSRLMITDWAMVS